MRLAAFQLSDERGNVLARTPDWAHARASTFASRDLTLGHVKLKVAGRADAALSAALSTASGIAITSAAIFLFFAATFARHMWMRMQAKYAKLQTNLAQQATAAGEHLERQMHQFAQITGLLLWLIRPSGEIRFFGPWEERVGSPELMTTLEQASRTVVNGKDYLASLEEALKERRSWSLVFDRHVDGDTRTFQAHGSPLFNVDRSYAGLFGYSNDITRALNDQRLGDREAERGVMFQTYMNMLTAHLSAPVLNVKALMNVIEKEVALDVSPRVASLLESSKQQLNRLHAMTKKIMKLAQQIVPPTEPIPLRPYDLSAFMEIYAEKQRRHHKLSESELIVHGCEPGTAMGLVEETALLDILLAVFNNAIAYSRRRRSESAPHPITVEVLPYSDTMCIVIEDGGDGLSPKDIESIGRPLFRGSNSRGVPGDGLELAIAKARASHVNAMIDFENAPPGRGLRVTITVPRAR